MLDKIKYINSQGFVIDFTKPPFIANETELRNYEWNVNVVNDRISSFRKVGVISKPLPITVAGTADEINNIMDAFDIDVLNNAAGKLFINDYYIDCFITASSVSDYTGNNKFQTRILTVTFNNSNWIKEESFNFKASDISITGGLDFDYDFNYDLGYKGKLEFMNPSAFDCDFRITIEGAETSPIISIGDNSYNVNCVIDRGSILVIDSKSKMIYTLDSNGNKVNQFNQRNRENYIFKKIKTGLNLVELNVTAFSLILYLERSEPEWI